MRTPDDPRELLDRPGWQKLRADHRARATALLAPVLERRRRGERHAVEDFLFDYYTLRPGLLLRWHPGVHRVLADAAEEFAALPHHRVRDGLVEVDTETVVGRRRDTIAWTRRLLTAERARPASFGCFGMHEWAMVYGLRADQTRHAALPLRLTPGEVRDVVDRVGLRCSHFDAFRFFTPDAAPRNTVQLTRGDQEAHDQGGCLHANMDLYKWAGKLLPLTPPEMLLDTYELARDIRVLDMRASAYDLSGLGYSPVAVETVAGRADYVAQQRDLAARAAVIRDRILDLLDVIERVSRVQAGMSNAVT